MKNQYSKQIEGISLKKTTLALISLLVVFGFWINSSSAQNSATTESPAEVISDSQAKDVGDVTVVANESSVPTVKPTPQVEKKQMPVTSAPRGTYVNTYGNEVARPYYADSKPVGAAAQCNDGTYSFSQSRRGTCSRHGGVARWY